MYELKKIGKVFTSKSVGTESSSYEKRIYQATFSQILRNSALERQYIVLTVVAISFTGFSVLVQAWITCGHVTRNSPASSLAHSKLALSSGTSE